MKKNKKDTRWMVSVALMAAIIIVLANTPLGMIQLPVIKATTVHIPVILGALLFGPWPEAFLAAYSASAPLRAIRWPQHFYPLPSRRFLAPPDF